jgi:hypothetical protein
MRKANVGNIFSPILSLHGVLNKEMLVPLELAVSGPNHNRCLAAIDPSTLDLPPDLAFPNHEAFQSACMAAKEFASSSPLLSLLPKQIGGIDSVNIAAAFVFYTMEQPFPFYLLITRPLNVQGMRSKASLECQLPFLKLLTVAIRSVPRDSEYWFKGVVYRGVSIEQSPALKKKYQEYEKEFEPGRSITFAAPTSSTTDDAVASRFTKGVQFIIQGDGECGPGGVLLRPFDLSAFEEAEVLIEGPFIGEVVARSKVPPGDTLVVFLKRKQSSITYLNDSYLPTGMVSVGNCFIWYQRMKHLLKL